MNKKSFSRNPGTSYILLKKLPEALSALFPQALYLTLFGIATPTALFTACCGYVSYEASQPFFGFLRPAAKSYANDFSSILDALLGFAGFYFGLLLALVVVLASSYFGMIFLLREYFQGKPRGSALGAFWKGLRLVLPRGLIGGALLGAIFSLVQSLPFFSLTLASLALMAPVVLVWEDGGLFRGIWRTLTLRFINGPGILKINALVQIFTLGILFFAAVLGVSYLGSRLTLLDEVLGFARLPWTAKISSTPFAPNYIVASAFVTLTNSLLALVFAIASTTLYCRLRQMERQVVKGRVLA